MHRGSQISHYSRRAIRSFGVCSIRLPRSIHFLPLFQQLAREGESPWLLDPSETALYCPLMRHIIAKLAALAVVGLGLAWLAYASFSVRAAKKPAAGHNSVDWAHASPQERQSLNTL